MTAVRHIVRPLFSGLLLLVFPACDEQPPQPTGEGWAEVSLSHDGAVPPEVQRLLGRIGAAAVSEDAPSSVADAEGIAAIDEAQIVVLDFTRFDTDVQVLSALDRDPDSLYDARLFDIRRDIWDNLVAAFKAYKGTSYRFAGQYPLTVREGAARGIIGAPPGFNLFFAALRSNRKTVYLYSALVLVVPGRRQPITLVETTAEGGALNFIALWTGSSWVPVAGGMNGPVFSLATDGLNLFAGGRFTTAGTATAENVAVFTGTAWRPLGNGLSDSVNALTFHNGALIAGGSFRTSGAASVQSIARWTGTGWTGVGGGIAGTVHALASDSVSLFAGGEFATAGGTAATNIARWNGTSWSAVAAGTNGPVHALEPVPGTSLLLTGGSFSRAGGQLTGNIAAYNGTTWSALGTGVSGLASSVRSILVAGGDVIVGGRFGSAGGTSAENIAVWRNNAWAAMGNGLGGNSVLALTQSGGIVFAGGSFNRSALIPTANTAAWTGTSWLPLKDGLDGTVHTMIFYKGALIAGGSFRFSR